MSELLFEGYSAPKVCYGVDALFSLFRNGVSHDALVISLGYHAVHVIPVLDGAIDSQGLRRINVGGCQLAGYLQRSMQLKYPAHVNSITVSRLLLV